MRLAIRKWGNSLALRLPHGVAKEVNLIEGTEVDVTVKGQQVLISRATPRMDLEQLLAAITPENLHGVVSTGAPRGREVW